MNICMEYVYRDAGNFKLYGEVVFSNTNDMVPEEVEAKIRALLIDQEFFVAKMVAITPLTFANRDDDLDHDWHTFACVKATVITVNDVWMRDIQDFIAGMEACCFNQY